MVVSKEMMPEKEVSVQLKECPVCHAQCFSDMDVCYGCLNIFKPQAIEEAWEDSVPKVPLADAYGAVEHVPQNLSAEEIDRQVAREEARMMQPSAGANKAASAEALHPTLRSHKTPGTAESHLSPEAYEPQGASELDASQAEVVASRAPSLVVNTPYIQGGVAQSKTADYERIASPMSLTDLLEIVISVRIAQDAKARCESHQRGGIS